MGRKSKRKIDLRALMSEDKVFQGHVDLHVWWQAGCMMLKDEEVAGLPMIGTYESNSWRLAMP